MEYSGFVIDYSLGLIENHLVILCRQDRNFNTQDSKFKDISTILGLMIIIYSFDNFKF